MSNPEDESGGRDAAPRTTIPNHLLAESEENRGPHVERYQKDSAHIFPEI
jgi:hypothetical protein